MLQAAIAVGYSIARKSLKYAQIWYGLVVCPSNLLSRVIDRKLHHENVRTLNAAQRVRILYSTSIPEHVVISLTRLVCDPDLFVLIFFTRSAFLGWTCLLFCTS